MKAEQFVEPIAPASPGALLRTAREATGLSQREAEEKLNWIPGYAEVMERDDYRALRQPAFARSYIRSYGRLLGLNEQPLMSAMDSLEQARGALDEEKSGPRVPLQLQKTGFGVVISLLVLSLLIAALWWWQQPVVAEGTGEATVIFENAMPPSPPLDAAVEGEL